MELRRIVCAFLILIGIKKKSNVCGFYLNLDTMLNDGLFYVPYSRKQYSVLWPADYSIYNYAFSIFH